MVLDDFDRFDSLERPAIEIFFAPKFIQIQVGDDIAENNLGLDDFKSGLDEVRVIIARERFERANVAPV
jgi:hypothetical protein